jgi:hypothetical protein
MLLIYDSIIALTLSIMAAFITLYIARLPQKARSTGWFAAFFLGITLVTLALFLEASILVWGRLFFGLRVCAALAAQASLIQFAYHFPQNDQPREARLLLRCFLGLLLLALIASGVSGAQVLTTPARADPVAPLMCRLFRQSAVECGWRDRHRPPLQKPCAAPGRAADALLRVPTPKSLHLGARSPARS